MGWFTDEAPGHEGYMLGVMLGVRVGTTERGWVRFRELGPEDDEGRESPVRIIQVGCDCGWRSQRLRAPFGTTWSGVVILPQSEQERETAAGPAKPFETVCRELWREHALGAAKSGLALVED